MNPVVSSGIGGNVDPDSAVVDVEVSPGVTEGPVEVEADPGPSAEGPGGYFSTEFHFRFVKLRFRVIAGTVMVGVLLGLSGLICKVV